MSAEQEMCDSGFISSLPGIIQEMEDLRSMKLPEQLDGSNLARKALRAKYMVELSSCSYQLLLSFLQSSRPCLILLIINGHIALQVRRPGWGLVGW